LRGSKPSGRNSTSIQEVREAREQNPAVMNRASLLAAEGVNVGLLMHDRLKELSHQAKAAIGTGEATPFAK
jgi:D-ribose pyranose/furanose isomerase RbsD